MSNGNVVDEVEERLRSMGVDLDRGVTFDWLTNRTPVDEDAQIPSRVKYRLLALHGHLGGDFAALSDKPRRYLSVDFQVGETTLMEVDRLHHFTSERLASLGFYDDLEHRLDLGLYRKLCSQHRDSADAYQRSREASDFPFEGGRRAQRAYFDTVQDLLLPAKGYRLIRLPVPDNEITDVVEMTLRVLI